MSVLYKRIHELESELALSLAHNLAVDKIGNAKATKALLSELSTLIDSDIRGDIISDAVAIAVAEARLYNVNNVADANYDILDDDDYNEINIDPTTGNRTAKFPDPTLVVNLNRKLKIRNGGNGTNQVLLAPFAAETFNVMSGNEEWTLASFVLLQAGDWCEFMPDGTNWIKCNEPYWHKFSNPAQGQVGNKSAGWTADQFTPGGFEVTFSTPPIGSLAVRCPVQQQVGFGRVWYRKDGDTNISNTPSASSEGSHRIMTDQDGLISACLWMSSDLKIEIAVSNVNQDIFVWMPIEYLQ